MYRKLSKLAVVAFLCAVSVFIFAGASDCNGTDNTAANAAKNDTNQTGNQQTIYQNGQPIHTYDFSQIRASLQAVEDALAKGSPTYTVVSAFGTYSYLCDSMGYPIPATAQLTNPDQIVKQSDINSSGGNVIIAQPEPTGVFTGNTAGTYVMCLLGNGKAAPVYSEPDVLAFPYPVDVVNNEIVPRQGGQSSVTVDVHNK